ncbi:MAG TPA: hypothetical protein P5186_11515 [Candidatus Paceibacterota bacterium]|nr:hypothetical protein [Verrucomicrobiota bacterium]HRY48668.1 hypothetical protein [Candidatus Paceibacterota bacterium]HSA01023.1 hypothetical protein [Candidatus Paceibacterota bacterium]
MILDHWMVDTQQRRKGAFALTEALFGILLAAILLSATILGYLQSARRAEWAAYYLNAQGLVMKRLEQTRAARWDTQAYPNLAEHNQFVSTNFQDIVEILDIPVSGGSNLAVTVKTTITEVSVVPPLRQIDIECVWPFMDKLFTNRIVSYRAPDQ